MKAISYVNKGETIKLKNYMKNDQIIISIDLGIGKGTAKMMTCDYSYDYVRINASYKT